MITTAWPLQHETIRHVAGRLEELDTGESMGLHQLSATLVDDAGCRHVIYKAFGRGADAQQRLAEQCAALTIGARYHVSATTVRVGTIQSYWMGRVTIAPDQRREHAARAAA